MRKNFPRPELSLYIILYIKKRLIIKTYFIYIYRIFIPDLTLYIVIKSSVTRSRFWNEYLKKYEIYTDTN